MITDGRLSTGRHSLLPALSSPACVGLTLLIGLSGCCSGGQQDCHDSVNRLKQRLDSRASATAALQQGCPSPISVRSLATRSEVPSQAILAGLEVSSPRQVRVRHVQLLCGEHALSDAWNWYVPERLSPEMNERLDHTNTPFGRVVQEAYFTRHPLGSRRPAPATGYVLENKALLRRTLDRAPIALVVEHYFPQAAPCHALQDSAIGTPIR